MPSCFKLLMLLSAPFPFRPSAAIRFARHSRHSRHPLPALSASAAAHGRLFSSAPNLKLGFSIRPSEQFHAQAIIKEGHGEAVNTFSGFKDSQSWPEWSKLADHILDRGYSPKSAAPSDDDDSLLTKEELPEEFLKAAEACLGFARERPDILRLLSKKNVEAVVKNGYPFLFKNSEKSARRMRLFIAGDESNVPEPEMAQTIDVMRYLLSIVQETLSTSDGNKFIVSESVETSARKLLLELFNLSVTVWRSKSPEPTTTESPLGHEPLSRPPGQSFEMKMGDWICSKCTFMNFARNMNCLECGEGRPKRQLTGAEWECPQCDFFNYGRNTSCLRCDCKRPGEVQPTPAPAAGSGLSRSSNIEQNFSAHRQDSNGGSSVKLSSDTISDSISRSLDRILGPSSTPSGNQSTAGDSNTSTLGSFSSSEYGQTMAKQRRKTDSVSFVPLPPDMFRKIQESNNVVEQSSEKGATSSPNSSELIDSLLKSTENSIKNNISKESSDASLRWSKTAAELDNAKDMANAVSDKDFPDIMPIRKGENRFVVSKKKDRSLTSPANKRRLAMEQANNFNYVPFVPFPPGYFSKNDNQPLTDSTESTALLDENETMPAGQGEHKGISDQVLEGSSSSQSGSMSYEDDYKPDYSGVKLNQSTTNSWDYNRETSNKTPKSSAFDEQSLGQNMANASYGSAYSTQPASNSGKYGGYPTNNTNELSRSSLNNNTSSSRSSQQSNASGTNSNSSFGAANSTQPSNRSTSGGFTANTSQPPTNTWNKSTFDESTVNSTQLSLSSWNNKWDNWSSKPPQTNNASSSRSYQQAQNHQSASKNVSGGYSGKSLEGSFVKELDPLDMSEEAKAERWFRRAAQIKDISELSQIPDEDFPEIMPMRKGVNRFVVSKRKTPQERRLTSPQYRRNLPIVSFEPEKDANN